MTNAPLISAATSTSGFLFNGSVSAATTFIGRAEIELLDAATNTWVFSSIGSRSDSLYLTAAGSTALSATLDRVRVQAVNGTDTFDAGSVNILDE